MYAARKKNTAHAHTHTHATVSAPCGFDTEI